MTRLLSGAARVAGVIGWPIAHSRSPVIHNHWLDRLAIDGVYVPMAVQPEKLAEAIAGLRALGLAGTNVTVPHKVAVMDLVDAVDDVARASGAANTLWIDGDGRLRATNTDGIGFVAHLRASVPDWRPDAGPVLLLGAGGAARGIAVGLHQAGVSDILVCNRTDARAAALADVLPMPVQIVPWAQRSAVLADVHVIANTTSLGMTGHDPLPLSLDATRPDAIVYDIVYAPLETPLLADARARGLRTVDGLGMLLHQATPGFAAWFGQEPPVDDQLRGTVLSTL